tara:strand:+ start:315 stop:518 length:204 start_codon:yes stop_codon:yes gene_type:complete
MKKVKRKKINVLLVRDIFNIPNKNYLYEDDIKRELEFFSLENIKQIFPKNNLSARLEEETSLQWKPC